MFWSRAGLLAVLVVGTRGGQPEQTVFATGNPHIAEAGGGGFSVAAATALITPGNIVHSPKATQPDTLQKIVTVSFLGFPLPIYLFQQPARLNTDQLPFKIVLVRSILGLDGARVINTPGNEAYDSWFPGYRWDCIVTEPTLKMANMRYSQVPTAVDSDVTHLGWRFSNGGDQFFALIVDYVVSESEADSIMNSLRIGIAASPAILSLLALESSTAAGA
eukprot:m.100231 g.100231  ORF g.100231 m.100231 type:complete len:219 (+) comp20655_c0_seq2:23-679(+)